MASVIREHLDFVILQAKQKQDHYKAISAKAKIDQIVHQELFNGFDQIFEIYFKAVGEVNFRQQLQEYM